jgi:pyruvate/2-oxoglutarate dehydrogenase complex dihydrolipoamide acyltransferase (E2) component
MMISSWSPPNEPNIYGVLECDVTNALSYIKEIREKTGKHITLTHIVIKAIGLAIKETPSVNGKLFLGRFIPYETIDVGCLVAIDGGRDLANAKITNVDKRSVIDIYEALKEKADKLRQGKDQDFNKVNKTLQLFPVFILRYIVYLGGFLSTSLGCDIPFLGIRRHPFGSCLVTSVGMMGLDLAFVPQLPPARVPILVMIGASSKKPIVENDQIVIKDMITITATLDHRFLDGSQAANLATKTRQVILNPSKFDIDELSQPTQNSEIGGVDQKND